MSKAVEVFVRHIKQLSWYHPNSSRHLAETLLIQNGQEGSYLIRPSSTPHAFAISVRCKDSVKHFNAIFKGEALIFGLASFSNIDEFIEHFRKEPLIAGESGITTRLKNPYPSIVDEPSMYDTVRIHAQFGQKSQTLTKSLAIGSKEGFLTKLGSVVKNWKLRWFVLRRNELSYFKTQHHNNPIRTLDLTECKKCFKDDTLGMKHCFCLVFHWRTFYLVSETEVQLEEWMSLIDWKLKNIVNKNKNMESSFEVVSSSILS